MASQPSIAAKSAVLEPNYVKAESVLLSLETTSGSIPHRLARYFSGGKAGQSPVGIRFYLTLISLTYIPVFLAALTSSLPLAKQSQSLRLPFFYDVNVAFAFLISFPVLIGVMLTDQQVLTAALRQVQREKVLIVSPNSAQDLKVRWEQKFYAINIMAQVTSVIAAITIARYNLLTIRGGLGLWAESHGKLVPAGYVYLVCISFDYAFIPLYVMRCAAFAFFLKDVVAKAEIHLLPFHPDHCGGLRPVGQIGMRNQYVLTVFGINVVLMIFVSWHYFPSPSVHLKALVAAGALAYLLFGPPIFIGPLLPFRAGMLQTKNLLMGEVAQRLRIELERLRLKLPAGTIAKEDEELIDRLRRIGAIIDELPVWPFDAGTLRKFLTAYMIPILSAAAVPVVKEIFDWLISKKIGP